MERPFKKIDAQDISFFHSVLDEKRIFLDSAAIEPYSHDFTEDLRFNPEIVLLPKNAQEVSRILSYCNAHYIAVTPRGAGTGLSGGALSVHGGACISAERMNRIIDIDTQNFQATLEPGVINEIFQNAVAEKGLFYPPDPASKGSCFMGGNVAHSSGGPHAVKYGTTKDYILNLEVVLPLGDIFWTGANTLKYSTGYHITELFTGSEGTLGFITKIVVKLLPLPHYNKLLLASFASEEKACESVAAIFQAGIIPSALEFMERDAIDFALQYTGMQMNIPPWVKAHLLIEVDGNYPETLLQDCETINEVLEAYDCREVILAQSAAEKDKLWTLRRKIGEAVKAQSIYKEEDTVVPRAYLPQLLMAVKEIGSKYNFQSVCYGHAGDGNLHVNILKGNMSDKAWHEDLKYAIEEIFLSCKRLGGTISGEHGIGYVQRDFMPLIFGPLHLALMRRIKNAFDPNGIMNPGKILL